MVNILTTMTYVTMFGVEVDEREDGFSVHGRPDGFLSAGGTIDAADDHRIAMSAVVAALVADGPTTVAGWDAVATSYPGFLDDLDALRGDGRG